VQSEFVLFNSENKAKLGAEGQRIVADWNARGLPEPVGQLSIHSADSVRFATEVLDVSIWHLQLLTIGFAPNFATEPGRYREPNNRSALVHRDVVEKKLEEWLRDGHVSEVAVAPTCCNPLSVVSKIDSDTGMVKNRVVLDMSRHVNDRLATHSVQLDDLVATEALKQPGDYMCVFDLENQYFHVRLAAEARQYFGFSWIDNSGEEKFYVFNVMVYGFAAAASVVTRLIKPIMGWLHDQGIRAAIYMDDGQIVGETAQDTEADMQLTLQCFQRAGWNVQWTKTQTTASQTVKYLGFTVNLKEFTYQASPGKLCKVLDLLDTVLEMVGRGEMVEARYLAQVLGKIASLRPSHGNVLRVMSQNLHHQLGRVVTQFGWEASVDLDSEAVEELLWLQRNIPWFNGRGIRNERDQDVFWEATSAGAPDTTGGETSCTDMHEKKFSFAVDNKVETVAEFPEPTTVQQAVRELKELEERLDNLSSNEATSWRRIFWKTGSRNCHNWLKRGVCSNTVRALVLRIKYLELREHVEVVPVWQTQDRQVIQETDNRSKLTVSTDEWGVDREQLHQVFHSFSLWPTVDAFASSDNAVCGRFFAKWPQVGDMTVNFFAQSLNKTEIYFCCPPVKDIGHTIRRLQRFPGITAILVLPAWSGHPFWSLLRRGTEFRSEVMMYKEFTAKFQDTGCGRSLFARKQGMDIWMGVWHTGTYLDCRVY
jgi:hypothetical protein